MQLDAAVDKIDMQQHAGKLKVEHFDFASVKHFWCILHNLFFKCVTVIRATSPSLTLNLHVLSGSSGDVQTATSYIRWGRKTCERNASLVYTGNIYKAKLLFQ